jgi:predicted nucleic acid-binding protein
VIHLDTNALVAALVPGSRMDSLLRARLHAGETLNVSSIVWAEFLCGPVRIDHRAFAQRLFPLPEPFLTEDAVRSATLFNDTGRRRGSLLDCMIAAVALRVDAPLLTLDLGDFRKLAAQGLRLLAP